MTVQYMPSSTPPAIPGHHYSLSIAYLAGGDWVFANLGLHRTLPIRNQNDIDEIRDELTGQYGFDKVAVINWREFDR